MSLLRLFTCFTCAAGLCWADGAALPAEPQKVLLPISLITTQEETKQLISLGWQEQLLGNSEGARNYFEKALQLEPQPMALAGMLMLLPSGSEEYSKYLQELRQLMAEQSSISPAEGFYLNCFLKLISGDLAGAAADFRARALKYRADRFAACWALVLGHYAGQGSELAELILHANERFAEHPFILFASALQEEHAENPSELALQRAAKAAELFPHSAHMHWLHGHLLYRRGERKQAAQVFSRAFQTSSPFSESWYACGLYLATAKRGDFPGNCAKQSEPLARWEVSTLPLRLLLFQKKNPNAKEIRKAVQAARYSGAGEAYTHYTRCLHSALQVRFLARKRAKAAALAMKNAEEEAHRFHVARTAMQACNAMELSCMQRAELACKFAILAARIHLYPDSLSLWKDSLEELAKSPLSRMLPPIVPMD